MDLELLTLSLDPDTGAFPREPLAGLEGRVVSVVEHFFTHHGEPRLLLVVHTEPQRPEPRQPKRPRSDPRASLAEPDQALFDQIRAWRNSRAEAEGVPPYVVCTNRQLAEIVRTRPDSLTALRGIDGLGQAKVQRFGKALLEALAELSLPRESDAS